MADTHDLETRLGRFPRARLGHLPTPLERMERLGAALGIELWVKRDDCTGVGFGGNKVRQLEFYLGQAVAEGADTILITGAVQSNFVRTAAAMGRRLGMGCHVQLEDRVPGMDGLYHASGNVLLDRLLGATLHTYPEGEDEAGADAALERLAERLRLDGRRPFIVPLAAGHPPTGALGYAAAAAEIAGQGEAFDRIVLGSGSALTHAGMLAGLAALSLPTRVTGVCVRRGAREQHARVLARTRALSEMLDLDPPGEDRIDLRDETLVPGYGRLNAATREAIRLAAETEGLFLDPVYTGKTLAGLIALAREGALAGERVLFLHSGGQPAIFAYGEALIGRDSA